MKMLSTDDMFTMALGAGAWAVAIPAVKIAGTSVANEPTGENTTKVLACVVGVGIAYITTPLLSYIRNWKTSNEKVRGIALALGTAQVVDGLCHMFYPTFYTNDPSTGLACAGNIFYGAGLLGIFSAIQ